MDTRFRSTKPLHFSIPISLLIIASGIYGIFFKSAYSQETHLMAVQGVAQDLANLILAVPSLMAGAFLIRRGSIRGIFIWLGAALYVFYTFVVYCFAVHFNSFFLVYCAVLGLTFYSIISLLLSVDLSAIKNSFAENKSNNVSVYFLIVISVLFFLIWMKAIIPALASGEPPQELREDGLLTNPVHVLDLSFFLPGIFTSGILLKKKKPLGYLFAPSLITFSTMMLLTICALIIGMKVGGMASDITMLIILMVVVLISCLVLINLMRTIKKYS
ncbi:MAG TPA: hypothetical protein VLX91_01635 [Candidatus Acidoferrales bacterium]|nr:hypothetical protein [Candidatus Acidoferrales bacterium]